MGKVKGLAGVGRDGEGDVGSHGEISGGCHDRQHTADTVHNGDHIGEAEVSAGQQGTKGQAGLRATVDSKSWLDTVS